MLDLRNFRNVKKCFILPGSTTENFRYFIHTRLVKGSAILSIRIVVLLSLFPANGAQRRCFPPTQRRTFVLFQESKPESETPLFPQFQRTHVFPSCPKRRCLNVYGGSPQIQNRLRREAPVLPLTAAEPLTGTMNRCFPGWRRPLRRATKLLSCGWGFCPFRFGDCCHGFLLAT